MNRNFVWTVVLSVGILWGWDHFVMRPRRAATPPPAPAAAVNAPAAAPNAPVRTPEAASVVPDKVRLVEYTFGDNRVSINLQGASVHQWEIKELDTWIPLVPPEHPDRALETFPDVAFAAETPRADGVTFAGQRSDGLSIRKTYRIDPAGNTHALSIALQNTSKAPVTATYGLGWGPNIESGDVTLRGKEAVTERVIAFDPPRLFKLKPSTVDGNYAWWATDSRYFLAAFLNPNRAAVRLHVEKEDKHLTGQEIVTATLAPGQSVAHERGFYLGPKGYEHLRRLGVGLERAVDFGFFGEIGKIILKALYRLQGLTGNYGWAIVVLTVLYQILVLPLTIKSFRHSQRMKVLQPQMKKLQELYAKDPKRLQVEMANMYRRNGLKFMGMEGCLPILVQIPIFFALYTTLSNAYELRGAPWIGWIRDLSLYDPFYVMPVVMGLAQFLQSKLSMTAMDPAQARMMMIMPLLFMFLMFKFPAGLVLYWTTQSLVSILIQVTLMKTHRPFEAAHA